MSFTLADRAHLPLIRTTIYVLLLVVKSLSSPVILLLIIASLCLIWINSKTSRFYRIPCHLLLCLDLSHYVECFINIQKRIHGEDLALNCFVFVVQLKEELHQPIMIDYLLEFRNKITGTLLHYSAHEGWDSSQVVKFIPTTRQFVVEGGDIGVILSNFSLFLLQLIDQRSVTMIVTLTDLDPELSSRLR